MSEFIFNELGVCTNPDKVGEVNNNCIYVAFDEEKGWLYGFNIECNNYGGGYYPSLMKEGERNISRREAVMNAIKEMRGVIAYNSKKGYDTKNIVDCCNKAFDEVNQIKLF